MVKKIAITVFDLAEVGDYTLTVSGDNINSKTFIVKAKSIVKTDVTLAEEVIKITQGEVRGISITSTNDLTDVKITSKDENQVTAITENQKIKISVSKKISLLKKIFFNN